MKRLGKFTGKIYEGDEIQHMQECGVVLEEPITEDLLSFLREKNHLDCLFCVPGMGCCPERMKAIKNGG